MRRIINSTYVSLDASPNSCRTGTSRMNAVSKHVASATLVAPEWNNTSVIEGDLAWIHPIIVGKAGPEDLLFQDSDTATSEVVDTRSLTSRIVILSYRPTH